MRATTTRITIFNLVVLIVRVSGQIPICKIGDGSPFTTEYRLPIIAGPLVAGGGYIYGKCGDSCKTRLCSHTPCFNDYTITSNNETCTCIDPPVAQCGTNAICDITNKGLTETCACPIGTNGTGTTGCIVHYFSEFDDDDLARIFVNTTLWTPMETFVTKYVNSDIYFDPTKRTRIINAFLDWYFWGDLISIEAFSTFRSITGLDASTDRRLEKHDDGTNVKNHESLIKEEKVDKHYNVDRDLIALTDKCLDATQELAIQLLTLQLSQLNLFGTTRINVTATRELVTNLVTTGPSATKQRLRNKFALTWSRYGTNNTDIYNAMIVSLLSNLDWLTIQGILLANYSPARAQTIAKGILLQVLGAYATNGWTLLDVNKRTSQLRSAATVIETRRLNITECNSNFATIPCEDFEVLGGQAPSTQSYYIDMGSRSGNFSLYYDMYEVEDELEVWYQNKRIYRTNGYVLGRKKVSLFFNGTSSIIAVRVKAPFDDTTWYTNVTCPLKSSSSTVIVGGKK